MYKITERELCDRIFEWWCEYRSEAVPPPTPVRFSILAKRWGKMASRCSTRTLVSILREDGRLSCVMNSGGGYLVTCPTDVVKPHFDANEIADRTMRFERVLALIDERKLEPNSANVEAIHRELFGFGSHEASKD